MRIGIDARALTGRYTGDRTYWRSLLSALPALDSDIEYILYTRLPIENEERIHAPNLSCKILPSRSDRLWSLIHLPAAVRKDRCDLLHVQYTVPSPALCGCPVVTTIHDISFRLHPEWFPWKHRVLLNLSAPQSIYRAARVITDSESSRADILRAYKGVKTPIVTIPLGLPDEYGVSANTEMQDNANQMAKDNYALTSPFLLAVGVMQPRKNLATLASAFGRAHSQLGTPLILAIAGKRGWGVEEKRLQELAAEGGGKEAAEALRFLGYVPDNDLPNLYRACSAFAYPSLYEGFGLPPLEAMACGAPVLVSDSPPMPEVAGEAALIISALDVQAWTEAIRLALTDVELAQRLRKKGPLQAARFSCKETATKTIEVYRDVLKNR